MGNSSRSPEDYEIVSKYREEDWMHELNEEGTQIWRNRLTNESAELVRLGGVPSGEDLDIYTTRTMENDLVKVHHLLIDSQSDLCALYNSAHLLIEHIPLRLSTLRNFDREEALSIFASALRAFHLLEIKFGPVVPHEELIGFNEQGKTKVWLNRNSCLNYADRRAFNEEVGQASRRVQLLFEIIEQRARYVLLPPIIKEQIYQPLSSHLSALKAIEKFAYYQKLNLRKYLQLGQSKSHQSARPLQRSHARNRSYFTESKPEQQLCCEQNSSSEFSSGAKQNQMRRNYSLNNIHNQPTTTFSVAPQMVSRRSDMHPMIKHSIISNKSSFLEPTRPSTVIFQCSHPVGTRNVEHVNQDYHRQGAFNVPHRVESIPNSKIEVQAKGFKAENIQTHPETPAVKAGPQQHLQMEQKEHLIDETKINQMPPSPQEKVESREQCKIFINSQQFFITDQPTNGTKDEILIKHFESIEEPNEFQSSIQAKSPTFAQEPEIKYEPLSFAPSQQNFQENKPYQLPSQSNKKQLDSGLLKDKIKDILQNQEQLPVNRQQQIDEQRRLSIQNKASKLLFPPDFVINTGSLLNYCTSVESKLHMATNREHSIIDLKAKQQPPLALHQYDDQQIEQYIREKYSHLHKQDESYPAKPKAKQQAYTKVKRIESKYIAIPQKPSIPQQKLHPNTRYQTSLNRFPVEEDFLDVNFLEKSLDKRYNNEHHHIKAEQKRKEMEENDALNIAKLQEGLLRFSKSQLSQKNSDVPSKQHISKKHQHNQQTLEHSTGFESYYPFKEKKSNEVTVYEDAHLHEKSLNRNIVQHHSSRYHEEKAKQRQQDPLKQYQDNINEYSFQENRKSPYISSQNIQANQANPSRNYYIKQTQYSGNEYSYDYVNPFIATGPIPRSSVEDEDERSSSKTKIPSSRKISYEQLRQFLWN